MTMTRYSAGPLVSPEDVEALLVRPAIEMSVFGRVSTLVLTTAPAVRFPVVRQDPSADWVEEGAEIPISEMDLAEVVAAPAKLAGLTIATSELLDDSVDGSAATILGQGLARDLSRKIDQAAFTGMPAPAPAGLATLTGYAAVTAPADWENLDPFQDAIGAVAAESATITAWVLNPLDVTAMAKVKTSPGSNVPLLSADPTSPTGDAILGIPVFTTPALPAGTAWGLDRSRTMLVVRQEASIDVDSSILFTSDRVAVRGKMRAAFGFVHLRLGEISRAVIGRRLRA